MTEASTGNWDSDFANNQSENATGTSLPKAEFMKMDKAGTYKVRLVGPYVKFRKHFKPYRATVQDSEKDIDPAWLAGWWPQAKCAINVIDRADGRLKIMEKPKSLFQLFYDYRVATGKDPTGNEGPDWQITVRIPIDKETKEPNKILTEYSAMPLEKTPFTKEEMKLIFKHDESGNVIKGEDGKKVSNLWPLRKIYKSTPTEVMKKMWDELPKEKRIPPKRKQRDGAEVDKSSGKPSVENGVEPIEENMTNAPAEDNDLFGGKKEEITDNSSELF